MSRMISSAAAILAAGAVSTALLAAGAAGAAAHTHVERFDARATSQLATGARSFVLAERDERASTVIGHDVLFCHATTTHATCSLAFATRGGLLYAHLRIDDADRTVHGTVNGGAGTYAHARGTISGRERSASDVRITLRYQV